MIYLAYEALDESDVVGFPIASQESLPGALVQRFENGSIYYKAGSAWAHFVTRSLDHAYTAAGGPRRLGLPTADALDGVTVHLEYASIYRHNGVTAVVGRQFRRQYEKCGGPTGPLGFPIGQELDIPGVAGPGRHQRFEGGSLLLLGSPGHFVVVKPFRLFIGRINTQESDPWPGEGANDIYLRIIVRHNNRELYSARVPDSGDWSTGNNVADANFEIPVTIDPVPGDTVTLQVTVFDSDTGRDDRLGRWTVTLTAADGWGLATNDGIIRSGAFDEINSITAAHRPVVDVNLLSATELFWGANVGNPSTESLTWSQYAEAFSNIDNDRDWWDPTDWLDRAFFELVVEGVADGGNCVGLSLESIYSRKGLSPFAQPLDRFQTWEVIRREINVRHAYQVGAPAVYWFLGQFLSGNMHDPKHVFAQTRQAFERGDNPLICVTQNYDFSGAPHCVVPVAWDQSTKPWTISISDPNDSQNLRKLHVNPDNNSFVYQGVKSRYAGGDWTGGRLHHIPFSTLSSRPRTPVWEAVILFLSTVSIFVSGDAGTSSITSPEGDDLDGTGAAALSDLQDGRSLGGYFVPVPAMDSSQAQGEFFCRHRPFDSGPSGRGDGQVVARRGSQFSAVRSPGGSFRHSLVGRRSGVLQYVVKSGLSEFRIASDTRGKDQLEIAFDRVGSHVVGCEVKTSRDRRLRLDVAHRLGVHGDSVEFSLEGLQVTSAGGLETAISAGFGGLDVVSHAPVTAKFSTEYTVKGHRSRKGFGVPISTGVRIDLGGLRVDGKVELTPIDTIGGPATGPVVTV